MRDKHKRPYWVRVLDHFQKKNYITNGLTIPYLVGCRSKVYPTSFRWPVDEFLHQLKLSQVNVTLMTCPNIGQIVIGLMDLETFKAASKGVYRNFGSLYIIDHSFEDASSFQDIVESCQRQYSEVIQQEKFSLERGLWSPYSNLDDERLNEVSVPAIEEMMAARHDQTWSNKVAKIIKLYQAKGLNNIVPAWHTELNDIAWEDQPENLPAVRRSQGLEIIPNVEFDVLLNNMFPGYADDYREKALFHERWSDRKMAGVIDRWSKGEKLIPPTITYEEREDKNLFPADGKHRLNAAYCFNAKLIPIVIEAIHRDKVLKLLGL